MSAGVGAVLKSGDWRRLLSLGPAGAGEPPSTPAPSTEPAAAAGIASHLDELAEDMLDLLRRIRSIEAAQENVLERLEQLDKSVRDGAFQQAREVDALRRDILGEQKSLVSLGAFNALAPILDRFRLMRGAINPKKEKQSADQFDAAIEMLSQTVRSLGYLPFMPTVGESFDPHRMTCVAFQKGPQGVVLAVERPGFVTELGSVTRPAAVVLAAPGAS